MPLFGTSYASLFSTPGGDSYAYLKYFMPQVCKPKIFNASFETLENGCLALIT